MPSITGNTQVEDDSATAYWVMSVAARSGYRQSCSEIERTAKCTDATLAANNGDVLSVAYAPPTRGAEIEYAYATGYDSYGRVSVHHIVDERGCSAMLKRPEPDGVQCRRPRANTPLLTDTGTMGAPIGRRSGTPGRVKRGRPPHRAWRSL